MKNLWAIYKSFVSDFVRLMFPETSDLSNLRTVLVNVLIMVLMLIIMLAQ